MPFATVPSPDTGELAQVPRLTAAIALCTFNGERFLSRQLQSLASQRRLPAELVVMDDGSTDGTLGQLAAFAAAAPFPVRFSRNGTRLGYRANFMQAALESSADLIFFCDQDDIWCSDKLDVVCREFENTDALLVYHNATVVDVDERDISRLYDPVVHASILTQTPIHPWHFSLGFTQAVRRELLVFQYLWSTSNDILSDEVMAHDQWFFFLAASFERVRFLDRELVRHRQHQSNAYGVAPRGTRMARLKAAFRGNPLPSIRGTKAAAGRSAILRAIAEGCPEWRTRLLALAETYRWLADSYQRRVVGYSAPSRLARIGSWLNAIHRGDYTRDVWPLSRGAMMRDLLVSLRGMSGEDAGSVPR